MPDAPKRSLPDEAGPGGTELTAAVDAAAALHGVPIPPQWRDAVVLNFATLAGAARLVADFPLDDEVEPAPVFRA